MSLWDELGGDTSSLGLPSDLELEAPPVLHPVPLEFAPDAKPGEAVTARTFDGTFRDLVLWSTEELPPWQDDELPEDFRSRPLRTVCSRDLWVHHRDHPEQFPAVAQMWPQNRLWVWRAAPSATPDEEVSEGWDWMRRAMAPPGEQPPVRRPLRVQDVGPLTGREVTVRDLTGEGPGPWYTEVAVGEIEDSSDGFVVPCQTVEAYARAGLVGMYGHRAVRRFPVHRLWVRA